MKTFIPGPLQDHARNIMRNVGYGELNARGQVSYARRLSGASFPRYHAYVEDIRGGLQINLHIDQKAATYEGNHAHSGEYEGTLVEREMERILSLLQPAAVAETTQPHPPTVKKKSGFWS